MKRSKFSIMLAALLALCLLLPAAAFASSDATVTISPSGGTLYLRSGPGRDYDAVGGVRDGESIEVLSYGSVWSKIRTSSGKKGYIKNLYIDDGDSYYAAGTDYFSSYTCYTTANVNMRAGASTETSVIRTLSEGTKLTARGKNAGFYLVQTNSGVQGYVSGKYLSRTKPGGSSGGSSGGSGTSSKNTKTVTGSYVNVREGGGMSYDVVAVLSRGTKVTVIKVGNYWTNIKCGSIKGWIKNTYLT